MIIQGYSYTGGVFVRCAFESIRLPPAIRRLERYTFRGCKRLKSIDIPNGAEYVGRECFAGSGLEEIALPASVREVGTGAFYECERLKSAELNEGLEKLGVKEPLWGCDYHKGVFTGSAVKSIKLPSTLKEIDAKAFNGCKDLKRVNIPKGVKRI